MVMRRILAVTAPQIIRFPTIKDNGQPSLEIERRFLVKRLPEDLDDYSYENITQGYMSTDEGKSIRLRHKGGNYYQTIKKGTGKIREEIEMVIPKAMYDGLWDQTKGRRIQKIRYEIPYGKNTLQLDIYTGKLEGFQTVEVEFESIDECDNFISPEWFGAEITEISQFTNKQLAVNGIPKKLLKQLLKEKED